MSSESDTNRARHIYDLDSEGNPNIPSYNEDVDQVSSLCRLKATDPNNVTDQNFDISAVTCLTCLRIYSE